jgi:hypothetical protein
MSPATRESKISLILKVGSRPKGVYVAWRIWTFANRACLPEKLMVRSFPSKPLISRYPPTPRPARDGDVQTDSFGGGVDGSDQSSNLCVNSARVASRLGGECVCSNINRRDAENAEIPQRRASN